MIKKILAVMLGVIMMVALTGCKIVKTSELTITDVTPGIELGEIYHEVIIEEHVIMEEIW